MRMLTKGRGFAVVCDEAGRITRVLGDELGLPLPGGAGAPLETLAEAGSRDKLARLLDRLEEAGAVHGWEADFAFPSRVATVKLAGFIGRGERYVVGAETLERLSALLAELCHDGTPGAGLAMAEAGAGIDEGSAPGAFNALSALNNELATLSRCQEKTVRDLTRANAEKARWIGLVSHELRNPLGVISAYAEYLEMTFGSGLGSKPMEVVGAIYRSSQVMLDIVNQLLDLTAIETGTLDLRPERTDLAALVRGRVMLEAILAERRGIVIEAMGAADPLVLGIDRSKIGQVIDSLLHRAVAVSTPGTPVSVEVSVDRSSAVVSVADRGPALEPGDIDALFTPFGGTGSDADALPSAGFDLGLAISRRVAEGHGGNLKVETGPGMGTVFRLVLPLEGISRVAKGPASG